MTARLPAAAALGAAALLALPAPASTAPATTVRVDDNVFAPRSKTVRPGTTVRFRWVGVAPHNVLRTGGPRFSPISTRTTGTVSRKLRRKGTYRLICSIHPGMDLRLRVR